MAISSKPYVHENIERCNMYKTKFLYGGDSLRCFERCFNNQLSKDILYVESKASTLVYRFTLTQNVSFTDHVLVIVGRLMRVRVMLSSINIT